MHLEACREGTSANESKKRREFVSLGDVVDDDISSRAANENKEKREYVSPIC